MKSLTIITVAKDAKTDLQNTYDSLLEFSGSLSEKLELSWIIKYHGTCCLNFECAPIDVTVIESLDDGIYDAMNIAMSRVSVGLVWFVNAGDVFTADLIKLAKELVASDVEVIKFGIVYKSKINNRILRTYWYNGGFIGHQAIICNADLITRFGKFDTKYKIFADQFLYEKILQIEARNLAITPLIMYDGGISDLALPRMKEWIEVHKLHSKSILFAIMKYIIKMCVQYFPYEIRIKLRKILWYITK